MFEESTKSRQPNQRGGGGGGGRPAGGRLARGMKEADEAPESSGKPLRSAHLEKVGSNAIKELREGPGRQPGQGSQAEENLTPKSLGLGPPNVSGRPCAWRAPPPSCSGRVGGLLRGDRRAASTTPDFLLP